MNKYGGINKTRIRLFLHIDGDAYQRPWNLILFDASDLNIRWEQNMWWKCQYYGVYKHIDPRLRTLALTSGWGQNVLLQFNVFFPLNSFKICAYHYSLIMVFVLHFDFLSFAETVW